MANFNIFKHFPHNTCTYLSLKFVKFCVRYAQSNVHVKNNFEYSVSLKHALESEVLIPTHAESPYTGQYSPTYTTTLLFHCRPYTRGGNYTIPGL